MVHRDLTLFEQDVELRRNWLLSVEHLLELKVIASARDVDPGAYPESLPMLPREPVPEILHQPRREGTMLRLIGHLV